MPASKHDPRTREEWQEAANVAEFMLTLESCREYGLITGGPAGNTTRCASILRRARKRGIVPAPTEELVKAFVHRREDLDNTWAEASQQ